MTRFNLQEPVIQKKAQPWGERKNSSIYCIQCLLLFGNWRREEEMTGQAQETNVGVEGSQLGREKLLTLRSLWNDTETGTGGGGEAVLSSTETQDRRKNTRNYTVNQLKWDKSRRDSKRKCTLGLGKQVSHGSAITGTDNNSNSRTQTKLINGKSKAKGSIIGRGPEVLRL